MNMTLPDRAYLHKIERLEIENERLRAENAALRKCATAQKSDFPQAWKIQQQQGAILAVLIEAEWISRDLALSAICANSVSSAQLDVQICKLRKKLLPLGVEIETLWGRGYRMTPSNKARLAQAIEAAQ